MTLIRCFKHDSVLLILYMYTPILKVVIFYITGTVQGGTQLQDFKTVGRQTFAYAYDLHIIHNSVVYVTVVAINRAGLRTVSYSDSIIIDKTPPVFSGVFDGNIPGASIGPTY